MLHLQSKGTLGSTIENLCLICSAPTSGFRWLGLPQIL